MKKRVILSLSIVGFVTASLIVFYSNAVDKSQVGLAGEVAPLEEYTITFDSTRHYTSGATDVTLRTSNGNDIAINLSSYTYSSASFWGTFGSNGWIKNTDPIHGLKSISYKLYSSTTSYITISYGWEYNNYDVRNYILSENTEYDFCGDLPTHFFLQNGASNAQIKSITLKYSCAESAKPATPGLKYTLLGNNTYQVDSYKGNQATVTIPNYHNGKLVTSIGSGTFASNIYLTNLSLPSSLTTVGNNAFYNCNKLTNVLLPASVTSVGNNAFSGSKTVVFYEGETIPNDFDADWNGDFPARPYVVGYIGDNTTAEGLTYGLSRVGGVTTVVITGYTGASTTVSIPATINGYKVSAIADGAFSNNTKITSVSISSLITSIPHSCFFQCSALTSVSFPSNVTSIENCAFYICSSLASIPSLANVESIKQYAFASTSISTVTFGNLELLERAAFSYTKLTSVTLPASLTSIPFECFRNSTSLESVTFQGDIELIDGNAFANCTSLRTIYIPDTAVVQGYAFDACNSLTILCEVESKPGSWSSMWNPNPRPVIWGVTSTFTINNYFCALSTISAVTSLHIVEMKNKSVTSLSIPSTIIGYDVKYLAYGAFSKLASLTSVTIPNTVVSIEKKCFEQCSLLATVTFASGSRCTNIGEYAFSPCPKLTSITIPNGVTTIGGYAFYYCNSMTSAYIPISVTTIGNSAFRNNKGLTISCEVASKPSGWSSSWTGNLTVVNWGV